MQAYMVDYIHYLPALENSDHMCIFSTLFDLENPKYNLHKADYVIMKELPAEIEWAVSMISWTLMILGSIFRII